MADNKNNQNFGAIAGAICAGLSSKEASWWNQSKLSPIDNEFPLDVPEALAHKINKYMGVEHCDPKKVAKWISLSFDFFDPNNVHDHPCKDVLDAAVKFVEERGMKVYRANSTTVGNQIIVELPNGDIYASDFKHPSPNTDLFIDGMVEAVFDDHVKAKSEYFSRLAKYTSYGWDVKLKNGDPYRARVYRPDGTRIEIKLVR